MSNDKLFGNVTSSYSADGSHLDKGPDPLFGEVRLRNTVAAGGVINTIAADGHTNVGALFEAPLTQNRVLLRPDLSNIVEVSPDELREAYRGPQRAQLISKIKDLCLPTNRMAGVQFSSLPEHIIQNGDTCQTTSIMNGLLMLRGESFFATNGLQRRSIHNFIQTCKDSVAAQGHNSYVPLYVIEELQRRGYPLSYSALNNHPIKIAQALWSRDKQFLVCTSNGNQSMGHVTTLLPLQGATSAQYLVEIDSLNSRKRTLSLEDFIDRVLATQCDFTLVRTT